MKPINRLKIFLDYANISFHSFEKINELSNGYIKKQLLNSGSIGSNIIEKIKINFPTLSIVWLLTGEGNMLLFESKKGIIKESEFKEEQKLYFSTIDLKNEFKEKIDEIKKELNNLQTIVQKIFDMQ
ncbi:MAG: hypothetical protein QM539_08805 [Alphaproteobacteria bacterium]|nr:hypothetical protein [Alphaproteobacteria bacterium]